MMQSLLGRYLHYSKRIALFGIIQWAVLALAALSIVFLSHILGVIVDDFVVRIINNVVTCSSALAVAICSGYYAHSAYDNSLKQKVAYTLSDDIVSDSESGNG